MKRTAWLFVTLGLALSIYYLSDIPNLHLYPEHTLPQWLLTWLNHHTLYIGQQGFFSYTVRLHPDFLLHKLGHVTFFGVFGVAVYFVCHRSMVRTVILTTGYALFDEWHQSWILGRSGRLGDVLLDVVAGCLCVLIVRKWKERVRGRE